VINTQTCNLFSSRRGKIKLQRRLEGMWESSGRIRIATYLHWIRHMNWHQSYTLPWTKMIAIFSVGGSRETNTFPDVVEQQHPGATNHIKLSTSTDIKVLPSPIICTTNPPVQNRQSDVTVRFRSVSFSLWSHSSRYRQRRGYNSSTKYTLADCMWIVGVCLGGCTQSNKAMVGTSSWDGNFLIMDNGGV
jgi:hypothetical protein